MKNADKPASPVKPEVIYGNQQVHFGLTKREQFAAMMLQGQLANSHQQMIEGRRDVARFAVEIADELLRELER